MGQKSFSLNKKEIERKVFDEKPKMVKMICCETEISSGKNVKCMGTRSSESGCFVLWQMLPEM